MHVPAQKYIRFFDEFGASSSWSKTGLRRSVILETLFTPCWRFKLPKQYKGFGDRERRLRREWTAEGGWRLFNLLATRDILDLVHLLPRQALAGP